MNDCFKPAVNGIGWELQRLTPQGWVACSEPYASRDEALSALDGIYLRDGEYRVYEALASHG